MWPETIWLLNDHYGWIDSLNTPGLPTTIEEWVAYCLPDQEARKAWYTMRYKLSYWETDNTDLLDDILDVTCRGKQWNYLVSCRYNITFGLLGYTEGQSSKILNCLPHIQNDVSFRNYHPVVYRSGIFYTTRRPRAQTTIIKERQVYSRKGRTRR